MSDEDTNINRIDKNIKNDFVEKNASSSSELDEKESLKGESLSECIDSDNEENYSDTKSPFFQEMLVDDNVIDLDQNDFDEEENEDQQKFLIQNDLKFNKNKKSIELETTKVSDISSNSSNDEDNDFTQKNNSFKSEKSVLRKKRIDYVHEQSHKSTVVIQTLEEQGEVISDDDVIENNIVEQKTKCFKKEKKGEMEDGEINDLEDGELTSDSDEVITEIKEDYQSNQQKQCQEILNKGLYNQIKTSNRLNSNGVCRFFLRGMCTWGEGCKYFHLPKSDFQNYSRLSSQRQLTTQQFVVNKNKLPSSGSTNVRNFSSQKNNENNVENAWERGLRQARELAKKKQSQNKFFESPSPNNESGDNDFLNNNNLFLNQSTSTSNKSYLTNNRGNTPTQPNKSCEKNSKLDLLHYEEISDDEISSNGFSNSGNIHESEFSNDRTKNHDNHRKRKYSGESTHSSSNNRHNRVPIRPPRRSRSRSSFVSSEDENILKNNLKSKVTKNERLTLSTSYSSSTFYDPWVRDARNHRIFVNNKSVNPMKINPERFFEENEEDTPAAYRCNLASSDITEKHIKKVKHKNYSSFGNKKVSSSSDSSLSSSSSFSSSTHSSSHQAKNHKNHINSLNDNKISNVDENNIGKKKKREDLLQKLKSVEKAIAKKRKKLDV